MSEILFETHGPVGVITLNRPQRLNAINLQLLVGLNAALERATGDAAIDVILLQAAGRAFCSGDDLDEFTGGMQDAAEAGRFIGELQQVTRRIVLGPKPVVCAAQGWIVGGGAAWPLNADFSVLADDAVLFCPEAGYGLFPSGGTTLLLPERCGPARAAQILWLGEKLNAERLRAERIFCEITPRSELAAASMMLAERVAALPAESRARYKQARARHLREPLEAALTYEAACCLDAALNSDVHRRIIARAAS